MQQSRQPILILAALSFLAINVSGFHLHADAGGHDDAESHAQDLHQNFAHDLEHEAEHVDVSVFEPARGFSKVEVFAPVSTVPELRTITPPQARLSEDAPCIVPRDYSRLRPPLRAPPISI